MDIHQFTQDSPLFLCQKTQGQQANASVISASYFFPLALTYSLLPLQRPLLKMAAQFGIHFTRTHHHSSPRCGAGTVQSEAPGKDLWTRLET